MAEFISFGIGVGSSLFVALLLTFSTPLFSVAFKYKDLRGKWIGESVVEGQKHQEILTLEKQVIHKFWGKFESQERKDDNGKNIVYRFSGHFIDDQHGVLIFKPEIKHADSLGVSYFKLDRFNNIIQGASVTSSKENDTPILVQFSYQIKES